MSREKITYLGHPQLRAANSQYSLTQEEVEEFIKCKRDVIYFAEKYVKIVTLDDGLQLVKLRTYQKDFLIQCQKEKKICAMWCRRSGKGAVVAIFFLWCTIFQRNISCGILANKQLVAKETIEKYEIGYENLPYFLQMGVLVWNKTEKKLDNGSKLIIAATSANAIRGLTLNYILLDEFAHVQSNIAESFFTSVFPTIASGKNSKIIITSTPLGYNFFYNIFSEGERGINGFKTSVVTWRDVGGNWDDAWAQQQLTVLKEQKFAQEYGVEFLGSSNTLIPGKYIRNMIHDIPKHESNGLTIYKEPEKDKIYLIVADPSEGTGNDDSAFIIFDVTTYPINIVGKFINNTISPLIFPSIIERLAKTYNNASVLIELNNNGQMVANILWSDLEYENMISFGFHGSEIGVRTTKTVKRTGCSTFKDMIECEKLIINDSDLKSQISTFIRRKAGYAAEEGSHDDLVMCCVLLAWFSTTDEYKNITNMDLRKTMLDNRMKRIEDEILPFGFIDDGTGVFSISNDKKGL